MKKSTSLGVVLAVVVAVAACVTINVYFPEAEIKDLSKKIEEQVREEAEKQSTDDKEPSSSNEDGSAGSAGKTSGLLDVLLGATPAHAQSVPDAEVSNPAIRKIIASRAARLDALNGFKAQGVIGESNQALVEVRDLDSLSDLRARAEVQKLVRAENADRQQLFREIAAAKNVDLSQLAQIQETYATTLREAARPGDWIQMPDGSWKRK